MTNAEVRGVTRSNSANRLMPARRYGVASVPNSRSVRLACTCCVPYLIVPVEKYVTVAVIAYSAIPDHGVTTEGEQAEHVELMKVAPVHAFDGLDAGAGRVDVTEGA